MILIFGPIFQVVFTFLFFFDENAIRYSMSLLLFNLLPIYPLDGSKILNIVLNVFCSFKKSHLITMYVSIFTMVILIYKFDFNLVLFLIISFIFVRILDEIRNHSNIFNRFLLERYTKDFNFKKSLYIKSLNTGLMKRDFKHYFYDGKRYRSERDILKKRFDFNSKS